MYAIRPATAADHAAYLRLFRELGVDDPPPSPARFAADLVPRSIAACDPAEPARVVGWGLYEILDGAGYIRNVMTDPAHRRAGIGRALMADLRARFVAAGARAWHLNVKPDNRAAIALYAQCGLAPEHTTHVMRLPREVALPPAPADFALVDLPAAHDADIEPRFQLLPGQLASARGKQGRHPFAFARGGATVGAGVFMPAVPGAFPFRLADPDDAAAAAARLREQTPREAPWLQLSAENDPPLHAALQAIGAGLHMAILHMRGPL